MKKVLITGKGSYVGTAVERRMAEEPDSFSVDVIGTRDGEWRDVDFFSYDSVFHVAGIAHVPSSSQSDDRYMQVNCELAVEVARKAKEAGVGQFIFMSSSIVYGDSTPPGVIAPIDADTPFSPSNAYGLSKAEAERRLSLLASDGFAVALLRCPMIYGPGCSRGNFPSLVKIAQRFPLFPLIENRRSMLYVGNLAELLCEIVQRGCAGTFMPQNGEYVATADLVGLIAEYSGRSMRYTRLFNPLIGGGLSKVSPLVRKAFGNQFYTQDCSECGFEYRRYTLRDSIAQIAEEDRWRS